MPGRSFSGLSIVVCALALLAASSAFAGAPPRVSKHPVGTDVTRHHIRLSVLVRSAGRVMISHRGVNAPAKRGNSRCDEGLCGRVWYRWVRRTTPEWSGCYQWTTRARNGFGKTRTEMTLCLAEAGAG